MNYSKKIFEMLDIIPYEKFHIIGSLNEIYRIDENLKIQKYWNGWINSQYDISHFLTGCCKIKKILNFTKEEQLVIDYAKASGFNWLAKDKNGDVYGYVAKPKKDIEEWITPNKCSQIYIPLSFLSWEDEEPYYIGN